ncbi:hypothetical protein [Enterococcus sp. DIV1420a]|uniref:hypothetical protein n=1 Tax=Enterococcus sp. DIV1420a TaxID=2774672 RepID=UPI003F2729FA
MKIVIVIIGLLVVSGLFGPVRSVLAVTDNHPDVTHDHFWLENNFNCELGDGSWGTVYLVYGIKDSVLSAGYIDVPSKVYWYHKEKPSDIINVQISDDFWSYLRGKSQTLKDKVTGVNFSANEGYKIKAGNDNRWDMTGAFADFHNLERVNLNGLNWNWVNDASVMFQNDSKLNTVNLGKRNDYSNIVDTSYMFNGCSSLQTV